MIVLPRKDSGGKYYISYSQYSSFITDKGFNTNMLGKLEYIQEKFFGVEFPDMGWGGFGKDVEDYICYSRMSKEDQIKVSAERLKSGDTSLEEVFASFTQDEKDVLDQIEPLGGFQVEVKLKLIPGVYLLGYIDDSNRPHFTHIRDYKTCSENSGKKYYTDEYKQLDIYSAWVYQETGELPKDIEVVMIERFGNAFRTPGRKNLSVGNRVWYHNRETSLERINKIVEDIVRVVKEISELYQVYLKMKTWKQ